MAYIEVRYDENAGVNAGRMAEFVVGTYFGGEPLKTARGFRVELEDEDDGEERIETAAGVFRVLNRLIGRTGLVYMFREESPVVSYYESVDVECFFDPDSMTVSYDFEAEAEMSERMREDVEEEVREMVLERMEDEGFEMDEGDEDYDDGEFEARFEELFEEIMEECAADIMADMSDDYDPYVYHRDPVPGKEDEWEFAIGLLEEAEEKGDREIAAQLREKLADLIDHED